MIKRRGKKEFIKSYQPKLFSEMVDTFRKDSFLKAISQPDHPRAWLFKGQRGCGKTTLAKIFAKWLNCTDRKGDEPCLLCDNCKSIELGTPDVTLMNMANKKTLDDARSLIASFLYSGAMLKKKVYILDEVHQMTKDAQESLLSALDEASNDLYVILCSMTPEKIAKALRERCRGNFSFSVMTHDQSVNLITEVYKSEGKECDYDTINKIIDASNGSPRDITGNCQAEMYGGVTEDADDESEKDVRDIAQKMISGKLSFLKDLKDVKQIKGKDIEGFRIAIASYFRACLINSSGNKTEALKFAKALDALTTPYYGGDIFNRLTLNLYKAYSALQ